MQARPRQYAAPMFVVALTAGVVAGVGASFAWTGGYNASIYAEFNEDVLGSVLSGFAIAATLPAFAIVQIVLLAIAVNNRFASAADSSVHWALGLTSRARRAADAIAYLAPQVAGTVAGTLIGGMVGTAAFFVDMGAELHREVGGIAAGDAVETAATWGAGVAIYVALALSFAAAGAAIMAALPSRSTAVTAR